jgi:hypothetical protein
MRKKKFNIEEVFTPSQPANYTFIERTSVNNRLDRALRTPGKQIIIYGYSGAGKTTLLTNKFKLNKTKSITTRCITGMTVNDLIVDAFDQLEVFYNTQADVTDGSKVGAGLSASYLGIKASLSAESKEDIKTTKKRAVELSITPQTLAKFIGESSNCWVIEDFHKIKSADKEQLAQIMKVFMDSSVDYPKLKIIAIGAVNSAREVVQYDPEMRNRISEIEVPLMNEDSLLKIINVGEKLLNIKIPDSISEKITAYSSGLAAVTHQLALLICEASEILITHSSTKKFYIEEKFFDTALGEFLEENSDTFKSIFETATRVIYNRKSENPKDLLVAILKSNKDETSVAQIKEIIQKSDSNYKGNNLKKYIDELTSTERAEVLRFNKESGVYYFSNPFIKAYCQCAFNNDLKPHRTISSVTLLKELKQTLITELEIARQSFKVDFDN